MFAGQSRYGATRQPRFDPTMPQSTAGKPSAFSAGRT